MVPVYGTENGSGNVSGLLAGSETGVRTEPVRWVDCCFVYEGGAGSVAGAESTSATE